MRPSAAVGRSSSAKHHRRGEAQRLRALHAERRAEQHDGGLDVKLGTDGLFHPVGKRRQRVGYDQAGQQRDDVAGFTGEIERPRNRESGQLVGRGRHIRDMAQRVCDVAEQKDERECADERPQPSAETPRSERQEREQKKKRQQQRDWTRKTPIRLRQGREDL